MRGVVWRLLFGQTEREANNNAAGWTGSVALSPGGTPSVHVVVAVLPLQAADERPTAELVEDDKGRGGDVAQKEDKEDHRRHEHLPFCALGKEAEVIQRVGVVQLEHVGEVQERKKEREPPPHPRPESTDCDVHVVAFTEGSKPVQASLLVVELPKLDNTYETDVPRELSSEHAVYDTIWPNYNDPCLRCCDEVMQPPPSLYFGAVDCQNAFPYRESAVVPDQQEVQDGIVDPVVHRYA